MYAVIESSDEPIKFDKRNRALFSWFHIERARYELVEDMDKSGRTESEIKDSNPEAIFDSLEEPVAISIAEKPSRSASPPKQGSNKTKRESKHSGYLEARQVRISNELDTKLAKDPVASGSEQPDSSATVERYTCPTCGYSSNSLGGVRRHITRIHGKDAPDAEGQIQEPSNDEGVSVERLRDERVDEPADTPVGSANKPVFVKPTAKRREL